MEIPVSFFCRNSCRSFQSAPCPGEKTAHAESQPGHPPLALILLIPLLLSAAGCSESTDSAEEKRKRYQVDNNISASNLDPESGKSAVLDMETGIAIEVDIDSLMARSKMLEMRSRQISFKEMLADLATQQNGRPSGLTIHLSQKDGSERFSSHISNSCVEKKIIIRKFGYMVI